MPTVKAISKSSVSNIDHSWAWVVKEEKYVLVKDVERFIEE
jgi:hypothetical protein